jgi:hypothetical protein
MGEVVTLMSNLERRLYFTQCLVTMMLGDSATYMQNRDTETLKKMLTASEEALGQIRRAIRSELRRRARCATDARRSNGHH